VLASLVQNQSHCAGADLGENYATSAGVPGARPLSRSAFSPIHAASAEKLKSLERENRELRQATEILRLVICIIGICGIAVAARRGGTACGSGSGGWADSAPSKRSSMPWRR
jgi:hypothetical protein